ncbi:23S rRNA (adenine(1618)-N(6))-methyltransferase RlmF [Alkalimarinus alittae]|uniref:Ribosomal RNA large subunit methyltransferase F n=1 Tax=Alkalimarinus alittae TaxID=2961619 RepID=A0ABY6MZZ2_9ALTE|nr:23S rRNA (adenine(1618)-N(6))-methyltransferase RlmF [Alkalimarinus alittae]UZE95342.1 23S rRNA (adenine(1618)-N(6))-methyltransferase RlmF [Alkalimarinus alittae]
MKSTRGSKSSVKKVTKKGDLHPRNPHRGRYDLMALCKACPELNRFIKPNPKGDNTINFSDEKAVLCLNKALLAHYYHVTNWTIPNGYLCPPIPGRADYIHYVADLVIQSALAKPIRVLDVGTGANCIYPIIGSQSYDWEFVASDIDPVSVSAASTIVNANKVLKGKVDVVLQKSTDNIFQGVIKSGDRFALTICNPPFHSSLAEAKAGSQRKWNNLNKHSSGTGLAKNKIESKLNFGGQKAELWCQGGEIAFLTRMAQESVGFGHQVAWFTSLVSKSENVKPIKALLTQLGVNEIKVIEMSQGQKISRLIAWCFPHK